MSKNHAIRKELKAQLSTLKINIQQMDQAGREALALDPKARPRLLEGSASPESNMWGKFALRSHTLASTLIDKAAAHGMPLSPEMKEMAQNNWAHVARNRLTKENQD